MGCSVKGMKYLPLSLCEQLYPFGWEATMDDTGPVTDVADTELVDKTMYNSRRIILCLTSCLFTTVVVQAYIKGLWTYFCVFTALTLSSIIFHTTHDPTSRKLDKCIAHSVFILVITDVPKAVFSNAIWLLLFPASTLCLWYAQTFYSDRREQLHAALHVVSVCGMHAYLCVLYA